MPQQTGCRLEMGCLETLHLSTPPFWAAAWDMQGCVYSGPCVQVRFFCAFDAEHAHVSRRQVHS